jgi:formylglycine-generating enzyme required for sulfatase activity
MKKLIVWSACTLLIGNLMAESANSAADKKTATAPAVAPTVQLVLELSDGSHVIGTPATDKFKIKTPYAKLDFQLSLSRTIEFSGGNHAAVVKLQNGDQLNGQLAAAEITLKTDPGQVVVPLGKIDKILIRVGSVGGDYVNSLGMEFITVPGTKGLFGIWDTRVQDYRAYAEANPGVDARWKKPGFKQGEDHPVVNVNWADAKAFCAWLTQKERTEGKIGQDQEYRLPTDKEWSAAVGTSKYPWGELWPPQNGSANYAPEYKTDDYPNTSPVGSFKANACGLYDMGGNVWQWCESWYRSEMNDPAITGSLTWLNDDGGGEKYRVVRGASWADKADPVYFMSSFRQRVNPGERKNNYGFRCVLAPLPTPPKPLHKG